MNFILRYLCLVVALTASTHLAAAPIAVGAGSFSGGPLVDFGTYGCGTPTVPGMTLSGTGFLSVVSDTPPDAGCSHWGEPSDPEQNSLAFRNLNVTFDQAYTRVGFIFGGNTSNSVLVDIISGGSTTGSFTVTSAPGEPDGVSNWIFYGFEDAAGIDGLVFNDEMNSGWIVGVTAIYAEGTVGVPAPATFLLLVIGLAGLRGRRFVQT